MKFTIKKYNIFQLMIAIAIVGTILGCWRISLKWLTYKKMYEYHYNLELIYNESIIDGPRPWIKFDFNLDALDPERPPISPFSQKANEIENIKKLSEYHAKMCKYWSACW